MSPREMDKFPRDGTFFLGTEEIRKEKKGVPI